MLRIVSIIIAISRREGGREGQKHTKTDTHASFLVFAKVMAEITQKYGMQNSEQDRVSNANVTHERHTVCVSGRQDFCVLLKLIFPRPLPGLGCSDPEAMPETTAIVPVLLDDRGLDYSHTVFASEPYPNHRFHMTRF